MTKKKVRESLEDQFIVVCAVVLLFGLWSSIEEFLYKGNVGVLEEMLSKFPQNPK